MDAKNVVAHSASRTVVNARRDAPTRPAPVRVRFETFVLDEPNALLLRDGRAVTLAPRPFALLCALARRPGSLVTKNMLLDDVWGHQYFSESVLKTAVSNLRAVLGDDPHEPRFVQTVSRRGYRFIAALMAMDNVAVPAGGSGIRLVTDVSAPRDLVATASASLPARANLQPVYPTPEEVRLAHALRQRLHASYFSASATESSCL